MKKYHILFILITFCLLFLLFSNSINLNQNSDSLGNPNNSPAINISTYSAVGSPLNVTEYANRTDAAQSVTLRWNATSYSTTMGSAYAFLPPNWQGNRISVNLYNLYENRCWNLNPTFSSSGYTGASKNISKVFEYGNNYLAGIRKDGLDKTFYIPFTFGKITSTTTQNTILNRTLKWMGLPTTADILILDDDAGSSWQTYYETSLTALGYTYTTRTIANQAQINPRNLVIWCTGENYQIESGGASPYPDYFINYLNQAGKQNLIVSGQDVGYCLDDTNSYNTPDAGANNFYNNYLFANFVDDDALSNVTRGISGDTIGNQLSFFINRTAPANNLPDIIMTGHRNNESRLYNWTGGQTGNNNNDDWYYRLEKDGHGVSDDCLLLMLEDEKNLGYDTNDEVWVKQDLYINRSNIKWAGISFDYWGTNTFAPFTGSFKIFVSINNTEVYSKSFADIAEFRRWFSTGMIPINITAIPLPRISLKIGLRVTYGINYNPDIKPMVMIDNFRLYLQTKVSPSQLNLKMDGLTVTGGAGFGKCTFTPSISWKNSPVQVNFSWTPSPTPNPNLDIRVTFSCDTNLFAFKNGLTLYAADPAKTGIFLKTDHGLNNSISFQYYISMPNGYWNHSFTIFHPSDWTFTFISEPQFPLINKKQQCLLGRTNITIPATVITSSPNAYWRFEAQSSNYIKTIQPQIYNGSHWLNSNAFSVTNRTRITAYISNSTGVPPNLPTSSINLTILNPNNQLWHISSSATFLNGWAIFPNLTIFGTNTTGGLYQIAVAWNNGLEAGYHKSNFTVIHDSKMILSKPTDAVLDRTAEINYGELLLIRVGLNDTNRNELVKGVNVKLNWTQSGSPTQVSLNDLGTGQYEVVLDTSDLPSINNYTIMINSYSSFFKNASYVLNLIVTTETLLSSPQYPKIIAQWGQNITIQVDYVSAIGEIGLNNSRVMVNWTLGPHSVSEIGNGRYNIEINLSYASLREYTLSINATRPNSAFKTLKITLEIIRIQTELTSPSYPRIITEWAQNCTIIVDYHTLLAVGVNQSLITVNWTSPYYSIYEIGKGLYGIKLNTSWCGIRDYILKINASKPYYQSKVLLIIIKIERVETLLSSPQYPKQIAFWGDNISLQVDYLRALDEQGILDYTLTLNWTTPYSKHEDGNGRYIIELDLTYSGLLEYVLEINTSKLNYELKTIRIKIEVKPIETELISGNYPRVTVAWSYNTSIVVNYRRLLGLIGINSSMITKNWTQSSLRAAGTGLYQIQLNTSWCAIQEYVLEIKVSKQYHQNKTLYIIIEIKALETELISNNYPRIIGPWGQNLSLVINYRTIIGSNGIESAIIATNWTSSSIVPLSNGLYQITLNTSWCIIKDYLIEITAAKPYHLNKTIRITVQINAIETELTSAAYPRIIGPWNSNITFTINYRTIDFEGINNSLITVNWTQNYYSISPLGNGIYQIRLNTSWCSIREYLIEIKASRLYHQNKSLRITTEINTIETELISDNYPLTIVEWSINATIEINFRTTIGLKGINNSIITVNWTVSYYSISDRGNGLYQIKLNTNWCNIQEYLLQITASKLNYQSKTLQIKIRVEVIKTELVSDNYPRITKGWNLNSTIIINYRTATESKGINNAFISVNWTTNYYTINPLGNGLYQIELNTSWCLIREYRIEINALKPFHQNKTLRIIVEINPVETELVSDNYPRVTEGWNLNSTIIVDYHVANGPGIGNALISVNWTTNYYTIIPLGNGLYQIELNTSWCLIGTYRIEINASKLYHQSRTLRITLEITAAETDLISPNYPRATGEYNRNLSIYINYRIAGLLWGINNSIITINWTVGYYSIYESGNGIYQIVLNTSLSGVHAYLLEIHASKLYHQSKTLRIIVDINFIETELTSEAYPRLNVEWSKNASIDLFYYMTIGLQGISGASISLNWTGGYYSVVSVGSGLYRLELNTSWTSIQQYLLEINVSKQYHFTKTLRIKIAINPVETILSYKPIDTIPYGENGTIYLKFVELGGFPIPEGMISVNATHSMEYNSLDPYPYKLTIATASLTESTLINITVSKLNHRTQTILIALSYRSIFTSLTTLNQTLIILPVEESIVLFIEYNNSERTIGIEGANLTFYGYGLIASQGLGAGRYQINITATTSLDAYTILITAKRAGYMERSIQFVVQVKRWLDFSSTIISADLFEKQVGASAYFSVVLQNEFTGAFFEPDDLVLFYTWGTETGNLSYNGNGNYSLILNTAGKAPGTHTIIVNATTKNGHLLMSKTVTMVITGQPLSWYEKNSWVFGVIGALCAIVVGYGFRNKWRERKWEKKVKHIYILTKTGIPLYDKRLGGVTTTDASLVTSALIGISSIVQEIVQSKRALKTIDHMDNKILFQYGFQVISAVMSSADLPIIRRKLAQVTIRFEDHFKKELENWRGDIDAFFGANKIINEFFPIEEYIKDLEISIEWVLERLFEMFGLSGIVTLLTIGLGLKAPERIAAGTGIDPKKVPIIIRSLQDLLLIDAETNLTARGKKAIAIYKDRKEKYMKIQRLTIQQVDITKKEDRK